MALTLSSGLIGFYQTIQPPERLPKNVEVLFPQKHKDVIEVARKFFNKYYSDNKPRRLIFGINPGRFGGGITGINFTGPIQLSNYCQIDHPFGNGSELSAEFIYEVIEKYGGAEKFYADYFISAVCPLGFVKNGINLNYYDDRTLQQIITPFVIENIEKQLALGFRKDRCFCIGGAKNYEFFSVLNNQYHFFEEVVPLPHPRFILQYRRKQKDLYSDQYIFALRKS